MSSATAGPNRMVIGVALVALVAVSVGATWIAASRIRSPAEVAARTRAPEPSPILVPVEERVVSTTVVTRGTGRFGSPQSLLAVPSTLKSDARIIDWVATVGTTLAEGDEALVVSGRPVIILEGARPMFRDLGPGMTGSDVLQFEEALDRLGHSPGEIDGVYDEATENAVSSWYESLGYSAFTATADQLASIRAIEGDLTARQRETLAAAEAVAAARTELVAALANLRVAELAAAAGPAAVTAAEASASAAIAVAQGELDQARGAADIAWRMIPPSFFPEDEVQLALVEWENLRAGVTTAEAALELAKAEGEASIRDAEAVAEASPREVENAAAGVYAAQERLDAAQQALELNESPTAQLEVDLEVATARAGVQVPADEVVFVPETPVRLSEVHVRRGDDMQGPLLSVTDAIVAIDGTLALDQVGFVEPGMQVEISEPDLGIATTGVVNLVADQPGTRGADGFHVWFETIVTDAAPTAANVVGASVRLTLAVETTEGPVLAVPASAVTLTVNGTSQVQVERDGVLEIVAVEPGLSAAGYVGITPVDGELSEGDLVLIGFERPSTNQGPESAGG